MVVYLFIVAVVNIGLGFMLAVYVGHRYRELAGSMPLDLSLAALVSGGPTPATAVAQPPTVASDPIPKSANQLAVEDIQQHVDRYGAQLAEADDRLRQCAESPDVGTIEAALSSIEATTRLYAENRDKAHRQIADLTRQDQQWDEINNDLQVAVQLQDAEIKAASQGIANFNYESDLGEGCRKMVGRTHRLMNANDALRDAINHALAGVAQQENRLPEPDQRNDPLTGCINRAGVETELTDWWASTTDRQRLCMAMVDIDRLAEVNEQFGYTVGNEILRAIARLLETECPGKVTVCRFTGQRFLLLFYDTDLSEATSAVERIRQAIENAHFDYKDFDIQVTVSCAATHALRDDTEAMVLGRAETALRESKRYGHNRTFINEGKLPTPVVPPDIAVSERRIQL